jgi:hypothetical protein
MSFPLQLHWHASAVNLDNVLVYKAVSIVQLDIFNLTPAKTNVFLVKRDILPGK